MSLLSQLIHGQQPEGGISGYVRRHLSGQQSADVIAGIDDAKAKITNALHALIGDHAGALAGPIESIVDSAINSAAAVAEAFISPPPAE